MIQLKNTLLCGLFVMVFCTTDAMSFVNSLSEEQIALTIEIKGTKGELLGRCSSKSLANCSVFINGCGSTGSIEITNNSIVNAQGIQATSSDPNFSSVQQSNGCLPFLPGKQGNSPAPKCSIVFSKIDPVALDFTVNNVMVKGTNTNAAFFDLVFLQCF